MRIGRLSDSNCVSRLETKKKTEFVVRGCECEQSSDGNGDDDSGGMAQPEELVRLLREVQPYMSVHRGRVFAVVLSAEIVASPYLDDILKVTPTLPLLYNVFYLKFSLYYL